MNKLEAAREIRSLASGTIASVFDVGTYGEVEETIKDLDTWLVCQGDSRQWDTWQDVVNEYKVFRDTNQENEDNDEDERIADADFYADEEREGRYRY